MEKYVDFSVENFENAFHSFSTDFKKYTSMSIHQYIIKERLAISLKYLDSPQYTLADIAVLCGFKDSAHYIHTFQKYYGINPTQYRKEIQNN